MPKNSSPMLEGTTKGVLSPMNPANAPGSGSSTEKFSKFQPKEGGDPKIVGPNINPNSSGLMPGIGNKKGQY